MTEYKVQIDHHDSWDPRDNYTEYRYFSTEKEAKDFVSFKMRRQEGAVPEHYENAYYIGIDK